MKVKAIQKTISRVDVDVEAKDVCKLICEAIKDKYNFDAEEVYIDAEGNLMTLVGYDHHHGAPEYEILQKASPATIRILQAYDDIRTCLYDLEKRNNMLG